MAKKLSLSPKKAHDLLVQQHLAYFTQRCFQHLNPGDEYIFGKYLYALAYNLEKVASGEIKRLIISLPPRHMKSIMASVAFPAWLLGRDPTRKIVAASYGTELSDMYSLQTRDIMQTSWYQRLFPAARLDKRHITVNKFDTLKKGYRIATTVGGALTGRGGNVIIVDDPMKAKDGSSQVLRDSLWDWYSGTLATRLNNPKTDAIVVIAQRLHEDDLIGRLLIKGGWNHLMLPGTAVQNEKIPIWNKVEWVRNVGDLLHPERIDDEVLAQLKRELGTYHYSAQIQQDPVPIDGNLVRKEWFITYDGIPTPGNFQSIVQSWDTAQVPGAGNDFSVCTTWGVLDGRHCLIDVYRGQLGYPALRKKVVELRNHWNANMVIVERANSGISLFQDLRNIGQTWIFSLGTEGMDKISRLAQQSAKIEQGLIALPQDASWLDLYLREMIGFPNATHDDQVDSTSQFLRSIDLKPQWINGEVNFS